MPNLSSAISKDGNEEQREDKKLNATSGGVHPFDPKQKREQKQTS
jgi:hypothetical protein